MNESDIKGEVPQVKVTKSEQKVKVPKVKGRVILLMQLNNDRPAAYRYSVSGFKLTLQHCALILSSEINSAVELKDGSLRISLG